MNASMDEAGRAYGQTSTPVHGHHVQPSYTPVQAPQQYHQHSVSPAPIQYHQHGRQATSFTPQAQHTAFAPPPITPHTDHYSSSQSRYAQPQATSRVATLPGTNPVAQRPAEVYHLSDSANAAIPADIREQFQQDEQGRVLFFTKPPLDVLPPGDGPPIHSLKYVAAKLRRTVELKRKREAEEEHAKHVDEAERKRIKDEQVAEVTENLRNLEERAVMALVKQMDEGTDAIYRAEYGDMWQEAKRIETKRLAMRQAEARREKEELEESERKRKEAQKISIKSNGPYLDDIDPRLQ